MVKIRHLLSSFLICATLLSTRVLAQSTLTEIRDTINTPSGAPFNGTVVITWTGYVGPNGSVESPLSTSAKIYNGFLSVLLVPTTTASASAYYRVVYTSSDGSLTWSEIWQVPPSPIPLSVASVRTSSSPGGSSGSGSGSGSGGSSGSGQYATLPISISEITGLSVDLSNISNNISTLTSQLNALSPTVTNDDSLLTSLNTTMTNLSTTVATLTATVAALEAASTGSAAVSVNGAYVDAETPSGTIDGSNPTFTLAQAPVPAASLSLYRNGLVQTVGVDFTLYGSTITFLSEAIPQSNDVLVAYYRVPGSAQAVNFVDSEIPSGAINGTNTSFVLVGLPNPTKSLKLYKNGVLLLLNTDYTLSGSTITINTPPQHGDSLLADYRY
ncbi:MAG: hypothetical protein JOY54_15520 [Acidobacteriaceae bacterium]|nr:hypothetical protein [Acidobacteriaceae bacterium]